MEVPDTFYDLVEQVCRDLYVQALKEIPPDVVEAIRRASQRETTEVARRIFSHYVQSIELGRKKDMLVCQDTGIPIYDTTSIGVWDSLRRAGVATARGARWGSLFGRT